MLVVGGVQHALVPGALRLVSHMMANLDTTSSVALHANDALVRYATTHHEAAWLARASLETMHHLDHLGSMIIAFAVWLTQFL